MTEISRCFHAGASYKQNDLNETPLLYHFSSRPLLQVIFLILFF